MQVIALGSWRLLSDPEATRRAYRSIPTGYAERCRCPDCRIYLAASDDLYQGQLLDLFRLLGIDRAREAEVYPAGSDRGMRLYEGWFHLVGAIIEASDPFAEPDLMIGPRFRLPFSASPALRADAFAGLDVVQLDFAAWLRVAGEGG